VITSEQIARSWDEASRRGTEERDDYRSLAYLRGIAESSSGTDLLVLRDTLCSWLGSGDEIKEYDALAMLWEFRMPGTLGALRDYMVVLEGRLRREQALQSDNRLAIVALTTRIETLGRWIESL
jgi:hypothetical protein